MSEQQNEPRAYAGQPVGSETPTADVVSGPTYSPVPQAPIGKVRSTGLAMFLYVITLGIYGLYWYYCVHKELKEHTGTGLGGPLALILAFFVAIVMPFITASEVGELYARSGQAKPVSGLTGLWVFPGYFLIFLPIVWFVKTNDAINGYWRALGATG